MDKVALGYRESLKYFHGFVTPNFYVFHNESECYF